MIIQIEITEMDDSRKREVIDPIRKIMRGLLKKRIVWDYSLEVKQEERFE